jgi:hypothetical protein
MNNGWGAIVLAVALSGAGQAQAGLIGNSINSLNYYTPSIAPGNATAQVELTSLTSSYPFSIGAAGLYFLTAGADSPIHVGDTQIVIGSNLAAPYCTTSPCVDLFNGFVFVFSSGVNITHVSIDAVTPSNSPWRNAAISLVSGTEIDVDLNAVISPALPTIIQGDGSNRTDLLNELSSTLVLDLSFNGSGGSTVPEPTALSLFGAGLLGLAALRRWRG